MIVNGSVSNDRKGHSTTAHNDALYRVKARVAQRLTNTLLLVLLDELRPRLLEAKRATGSNAAIPRLEVDFRVVEL